MSAPRIAYPANWPQADRDALDRMFEVARQRNMFFFSNQSGGPYWFAPFQLQAEQENGQFIWSAANWELRESRERFVELQKAVDDAETARAAFTALAQESRRRNREAAECSAT